MKADLGQLEFESSNLAFEYLYKYIMDNGSNKDGTKAIFNAGFYLKNPLERIITNPNRKWNKKYADFEWDWYLSGNRNAEEIAKKAKIWYNCMDKDGNVNSNYGYQWLRNNQIYKVISILDKNITTRRAAISIYDGKEIDLYEKDTPCTYAIHFNCYNSKLNMEVMMRSCDLIFGFCNDQYCFSKLQELISLELNIPLGWYYHFCNDLHIYERHYKLF